MSGISGHYECAEIIGDGIAHAIEVCLGVIGAVDAGRRPVERAIIIFHAHQECA